MSYTDIQNIIDANRQRNLAVFIGAGVSNCASQKGYTFKCWAELIKEMTNEMNEKDEKDYLKIAQLYYLYDPQKYAQKVKSFIPIIKQASSVHHLIIELNPQIIITTNWDDLLTIAANECSCIYDAIASDKELSTSVLSNKIIKMHGDFRHGNFVFKEDDYINYQYNFPLIENFIKNIMSTHTILFLGYSYNDINLKYIVKWIQVNSKSRPRMYLASSEENISQEKYLANYGIKTLLLGEKIGIPSSLPKTEKTQRFLETITGFSTDVPLQNDDDSIRFVLKRLTPLNELNFILLQHIQKALGNCGFEFDSDSSAILSFYKILASADYNESLRKIYCNFTNRIKYYNASSTCSPELQKVYSILRKANIKGIFTSGNDINPTEYSLFGETEHDSICPLFKDYISFNFRSKKSSKTLQYFFSGKWEEAFAYSDRMLQLTFMKGQYLRHFIAAFNRNAILHRLKYSLSFHEKYKNMKELDLEKKFESFPPALQTAIKPVYEILNYSALYKYKETVSQLQLDVQKAKNTVLHGGFTVNNSAHRYKTEHINLIGFVLGNDLMLEYDNSFLKINHDFIKITLDRQIQMDYTTLTQLEFFCCIKYFSKDELKNLFIDFYQNDSSRKGTFRIGDKNLQWLISIVLHNLLISFKKMDLERDCSEKYFSNLLFILSLSPLSDEQINEIMMQINKALERIHPCLDFFDCINEFVGAQYFLYKKSFSANQLWKFHDILLTRFVRSKISGYECEVLRNGRMYSIYNNLISSSYFYQNGKLVDRVISIISQFKIVDQISWAKVLMINLYIASIPKIKIRIKEYLLGILYEYSNSREFEHEQGIEHEFALQLIRFKILDVKDYDLTRLNLFLNGYLSSSSWSSTIDVINKIVHLFPVRVQKQTFAETIKLLAEISENLKKYKGLSAF